ncbi:helicase-associated domain-containing protein [Paenibacillus sp. TAB 01]|uniref:helicase-associated domain-containing protein n=1 Tax=Paenibacillus sp. TAB 01 TaxID=3368988 RepID=UPI0037518306
MNHTYYLAKMPAELRARIESETVYYPWLKQGETLEGIWRQPAIMETIYNQLSARERTLLGWIVQAIGCEPFDGGRLEKLASAGMSGADARVGLLQLLKKGLVYPFRKSWGEQVYVMAQDALEVWQQVLFPLAGGGAERFADMDEASHGIGLSDTNGPGLAYDLFHMLVYIAGQEVKLTKNGTLHKKQLQKLGVLLTLPDAWLKGVGIKYAYADVYPPKIAVMLEFLTRLQLIEPQDDMLLLQKQPARQWLALSEPSQNRVLYTLWKQAAFPGAVWLQHAAVLLERQEEGRWLHGPGLLRWLLGRGLLPWGSGREAGVAAPSAELEAEALRQLEQQWLLPLIAFGWMEKGSDREGQPVYRWLKHPLGRGQGSDAQPDIGSQEAEADQEESQRFYVQPDFELLVPPGVGFAVRWELSVIADLHKSDQLSVYRLTKESLQRAMENGRKPEEIVRFLERFSIYGVPDNVKLTLEQWAKPFGKVGLAQVMLLRCEDETVAEAIRRLPGNGEWLGEPLGDRAWIISPDQVKRVTEVLTKAGWMPGKVARLDGTAGRPAEGSGAEERWLKPDLNSPALPSVEPGSPWPVSGQGFIYARHGIGYFDMEQRLPDIRDFYPDLNGIPASWTKDYRAYHVSTRREMVEKALEWRAALQVRCNGRDHYIAPRKLQETRGT